MTTTEATTRTGPPARGEEVPPVRRRGGVLPALRWEVRKLRAQHRARAVDRSAFSA